MPDRSVGGPSLADDVTSADWIAGSVRNIQYDVGSLLPVDQTTHWQSDRLNPTPEP